MNHAFREDEAGRILVVDDEPQVLRLIVRTLRHAGYEADGVGSAEEAHAALHSGDVDLLLADVNLPGQSGLDLVRYALAEHPGTATLLISGMDDPGIAQVGLEYGAYGYLTKPFSSNQVVIAVMNAFRRRTLEIRDRAHRLRLERAVEARTRELRETMGRLELASLHLQLARAETIHRLAQAAEFRDPDAGGHLDRMSSYCAVMAPRFSIDPESLKLASVLHDVGKIAIPDAILLKRGPLTDDERAEMERHAEIGHEMLQNSASEVLALAATIALTHHEKYDGTGYPQGLEGAEIPLEGRIAAVADVFDSLTSERVYRPAWSVEEAFEELHRQRGRHFDPLVLDAFFSLKDEILGVRANAPSWSAMTASVR